MESEMDIRSIKHILWLIWWTMCIWTGGAIAIFVL